MHNEYYIVLGGGADQLYLINNIKKLNYKVIVFDKKTNCPGFKIADFSINIDFIYYQKVIKKLFELKKKHKLIYKGVITMGCDIPLIIYKIAKKFNLFSSSEEMARISQNKILMKKLFKKIDIKTPLSIAVRSEKQVLNFWKKNQLNNLIIKPCDASGSKGVRVICKINQIKPAIKNVKKNTKKNYFMIEELVEGPQLSTESIIVNNKIFTPAISYRDYSNIQFFLPQIMENGGIISSDFLKFKTEIESIKMKIARAMNFKNGIIKGDFVIRNNNLLIIEFTTRLSGGDMSESLGPLSNGVNYVKEAIKIAGQEKVNLKNLKPKFFKVVSNKYFFLPKGTLQKIIGVEKCYKIKGFHKINFYYNKNSKIPEINSHGKRVGVFIVKGQNEKKVKKTIDEIYNTIKFKVSNNWRIGHPKEFKREKSAYKAINLM